MPLTIRKSEWGAAFVVQVAPRASKNEIAGLRGDMVKVRLTAPPVGGAANAALVELLAETLGVSKNQIEIVAGETGRRKVIAVTGLRPAEVEAKLVGTKK